MKVPLRGWIVHRDNDRPLACVLIYDSHDAILNPAMRYEPATMSPENLLGKEQCLDDEFICNPPSLDSFQCVESEQDVDLPPTSFYFISIAARSDPARKHDDFHVRTCTIHGEFPTA